MFSGRRAVITGLGVLAANGIGKDEFWKALLGGQSGIGPVTLFDAADLPCRIAGEVKAFNPHDYVGRRLKPKRMGRFSQLSIAAASMAFDDAAIDLADLQRRKMLPIIMGVSTSAMDLFAHRPMFYTGPSSIPHAAGTAIIMEFNLEARLVTTSSACASSLDAVHLAAGIVRKGEADLAIAGGADSSITRYVFDGIGQSGMLSKRNDAPDKASRPFDLDRDGGIIAEGAGIVIIENLEHALARGRKPYCEVTGYGSCSDPVGEEDAAGMEQAMLVALANAGIHPSDIDAISAHGPSDKHLDWMETECIKRIFGGRSYTMPVSSIKGSTGNPFGTAGVMQVIAGALGVREQMLPPTANYERPDPRCDLDYVARTPRRIGLRRLLINAHGVGRVNSSLVIESVEQA